ncbi:MAG: hypothetical protein MUF64_01715 [Polyangiaceae bacterium]|jgi:hypothetical protein|nr:hypothetical protein [Polyangiaceae bacterium]
MSYAFHRALVLAASVHGAALLVVTVRPTPSLPAPPPAEAPIELSIEALTPPAPSPPSAPEARDPETPPAAAAIGPQAAPRAERQVRRDEPEPGPALIASVAPPSSAAPLPWAAGSADAEERGRKAVAGLFAGGTWIGGLAPDAAPTTGEAPRRENRIDPDQAGKLLRESMGRADQARGLGFGGPVASAARQASLSRLAPIEGAATFEVLTGPDGRVTSVILRGSRGGDWGPVVSELRALLAGQRLRVPEGAPGVAVAVRVEAKRQLPSGKAPEASSVELEGLGGKFDLADLSGKVSRIVSARVVDERRL